jgi:hypothetical protein
MFEDFCEMYMEQLDTVKKQLTEYRGLTDPEYGIKKVALWPKKLTKHEIAKMKQMEEEKLKREAEEEEKKRKEEEDAAAAAKGPGKKSAAASKQAKPSSRGGPPSTSQSARSARTRNADK